MKSGTAEDPTYPTIVLSSERMTAKELPASDNYNHLSKDNIQIAKNWISEAMASSSLRRWRGAQEQSISEDEIHDLLQLRQNDPLWTFCTPLIFIGFHGNRCPLLWYFDHFLSSCGPRWKSTGKKTRLLPDKDTPKKFCLKLIDNFIQRSASCMLRSLFL